MVRVFSSLDSVPAFHPVPGSSARVFTLLGSIGSMVRNTVLTVVRVPPRAVRSNGTELNRKRPLLLNQVSKAWRSSGLVSRVDCREGRSSRYSCETSLPPVARG